MSELTHSEFLQVFYRNMGPLTRFLTRRLDCEETAAELVQEIYFRVLRLDQPQRIGNPRTYLFRIAANLAIDHIRACNRRPQEPLETVAVHDLPDAGSNPEQSAVAQEELNRLQGALTELSPLCRQIFTLNRFEGLSYAEVAGQLGLRKNTVRKHIVHALNHCRHRLDRVQRPAQQAAQI